MTGLLKRISSWRRRYGEYAERRQLRKLEKLRRESEALRRKEKIEALKARIEERKLKIAERKMRLRRRKAKLGAGFILGPFGQSNASLGHIFGPPKQPQIFSLFEKPRQRR